MSIYGCPVTYNKIMGNKSLLKPASDQTSRCDVQEGREVQGGEREAIEDSVEGLKVRKRRAENA